MGKISEIFNFDNIGGKIKNLAKWSCWISILLIWIAAPIAFIFLVADHTVELCGIPLVAAIVGPVFVWIGSWTMYAFGEFVEDMHAIREKSVTSDYYNDAEYVKDDFGKNKSYNKSSSRPKSVISTFGKNGVYYECPVCGCEVKRGQKKCLCFSELNWDEVE